MGLKRGGMLVRSGVRIPLALDDFQLAHGAHSFEILRRLFPEVCEEIAGVADGMGVDEKKLTAWLLCMGCCMYNLERNLPELRGCTVFAAGVDGRMVYGRNNDLPPRMAAGCTSDLYRPRGGHSFLLTSSSFLNGEEAVNDAGLVAAMTFVMSDLRSIRPGLNSPFAVRYLAERCGSTAEALKLLGDLPLSSCCCLLLADRSGDMAAVECAPGARTRIKPVRCTGGEALCIVNGFSSDGMRGLDFSRGDNYRADDRRETVLRAFKDGLLSGCAEPVRPGAQTRRNRDSCGRPPHLEKLTGLLRGERGFICEYDDGLFQTVWSTAVDLTAGRIWRADGDPRTVPFREDRRLGKILWESKTPQNGE